MLNGKIPKKQSQNTLHFLSPRVLYKFIQGRTSKRKCRKKSLGGFRWSFLVEMSEPRPDGWGRPCLWEEGREEEESSSLVPQREKRQMGEAVQGLVGGLGRGCGMPVGDCVYGWLWRFHSLNMPSVSSRPQTEWAGNKRYWKQILKIIEVFVSF